jgi:hypothetical protein
VTGTRPDLTRAQILASRRHAGALDERLPLLVGLVRRVHGRPREREHPQDAAASAGRYMADVKHVAV